MKKLLAAVMFLPLGAWSEDLSGRLGVGGDIGAAVPIGAKAVTNANDTGLGLGGWLAYGLNSRWTARVSYDNFDLSRGHARIQPLMFGAGYLLSEKCPWNPTLRAGVGPWFQHVTVPAQHTVFGFGLGLGIDKFLTPRFSVGAALDWFASLKQSPETRDTHVLRPGLTAGWWFGGAKAAPVAAARPVEKPKPAPAPVVSLTLNPQSVELASGGSQRFDAAVTGASDQSVTWSLDPKVGEISQAGVYTAPAPIAIAQTVTVTAASNADPSKKATAQIRLKAPQTVQIALDVYFDTAKDVVKPEYNGELAKVADFMKKYPTTQAEIEGHTDNVGKADFNRQLSQRRADAVRQALVDRFQVDASRLTAKGYGPDRPISDNGTAEGRAKNRRVVATFTAIQQ
ncbi:MAG: OmpA family protein [Elusimicrobia bacterium]|nr:OmpA family protein [Elusimicrobiota bacterium]